MWEFAVSGTAPTTDQLEADMGVVVVNQQLGVEAEGKPTELEDPSPFPSEAPKSVAGANAAFEPIIAVVAVAAEVITK